SPRTSLEGALGCHFTIGDSPVQTRSGRLSDMPNEPPLREEDEEASLDAKDSPKQGRMIKEIDQDENVNLIKVEIRKSAAKDKGKGIMQESEEPRKIKKKVQIQMSLDEEVAQRFKEEEQARFIKEQELLVREREVKPLTDDIDWDDVQAQIQADEDLAQRMLEEERKSLYIKERSRLLAELIDQRKKLQAAQRAEAIRKKPPTKSQRRKYMTTFLKNQADWKAKQFKGYSFEEIEQIFNSAKKQNIEDEKESDELKKCLEVVPDDGDDVFVDVTPLASKPPTIIDYKIFKQGKKEYFQIFKANGNHQMYCTFSKLLKNFDRKDLEVLWKIVEDRFKKTQPKEVLDIFLFHTLKIMFEHHIEDNVWKHQQGPQGLAKVKN
ncbi:hypothetical protein Tco_1453092, partial [Tanacetum coccineum]